MSKSENQAEIADILNEHFCNIGPKLAENIEGSNVFMRKHNVDDEHFGFNYVTIEEVAELINQLSPSKACGVDGLTARLIKLCGELIYPVLTHIFNISFQTNEFPAIWKKAKGWFKI